MHWCIGALMHWRIGALAHWCMVHWCIGAWCNWCLVHFGIAGHLRIIVRVGLVIPVDDLSEARLKRVSSRPASTGLLVRGSSALWHIHLIVVSVLVVEVAVVVVLPGRRRLLLRVLGGGDRHVQRRGSRAPPVLDRGLR